MSITDLADACKVGDASVYRFCRTLGLQGYQEFKMKLSLSLSEDDVPNAKEEDPPGCLHHLDYRVKHRMVY